jgi:hypothetical protein
MGYRMNLHGVRRSLLVSALFVFIYPACNTTPAPPEANPADVRSMDAIIAAVYDTISGPAGSKRNWNRFRSLFIPEARLIPAASQKEDGHGWRVMTVEDYIGRIGPSLEEKGFFEKEVARRTDAFGNIAQAFSSYESRGYADEPIPIQRGINSFQLINDGKRWWVVTVFWQNEDYTNPIPERYLKKSD